MTHAFGRVLLLIGCLLAVPVLHAAPSLVVSGGILTGARNVDVGGVLYDVDFVDGSCDALFNGCNPTNFAFDSPAEADAASAALLAQVFVDGTDGQFDSNPALTAGCIHPDVCRPLTPFAIDNAGEVFPSIAVNDVVESFDRTVGGGGGSLPTAVDTTFSPTSNYAVWTRAATNVPVPGTLACLAIAGVALAAFRRRPIPKR